MIYLQMYDKHNITNFTFVIARSHSIKSAPCLAASL